MLSHTGKEVLIKAIAQAIPVYPMNILKFPAHLCKEMDSLFANFWWGQNNEAKKIHWVSWDVISLPKQGGLGFRNLQEFNVALLAKQCRRMMMEPDSLWARFMKARYFPLSSFLEARKGSRASWA